MTPLAAPFPPPTVAATNPYVGPRPMRRGETIHGRAAEITEIRGRLVSNRVLLLYSPSGAGKTSLIEAGLLPQLEQRDFIVFPTIRVGYELEAPAGADTNRYCASVIASLEERPDSEHRSDPETLVSADLDAYFNRIADQEPDGRLCLVFDQFEEVFTLNPADVPAKRAFFEQLGSALRNRRFWVLISMREDFIAQLDPYLDCLPTQLRTRFRLGLLGDVAAMNAARATANDHDVDFGEVAARKLVDDLRTIQVDHPDGPAKEKGPNVEPLQLQVVCRRLWERARPDPHKITEGDVSAGGGVNQALSGYYGDAVTKVDDTTQASERDVRDWFDDNLITEDGFRKPVRKGPVADGQKVLDQLAEAHLIRRERRSGADWYELTHDRFVEPIRESNRKFEEAARQKLEARQSRRFKRIMAIGLVTAVIAGVVIAVVAASTASETTPLAAESVELPIEMPIELPEGGGFVRYVFDPSGVEVVQATLGYEGDSLGSTAQLRLLAVEDGGLGAEISASSLKRAAAAAEGGEDSSDGAAGSASTVLAAQEVTAVIRRTVTATDASLVIEVASESGGNFVLSIEGAAGQGGPLAIGLDDRAVDAEITAAGDAFTASIQGASAGEVVRVVVEPTEQFDPIVLVRTGDGAEIGFADLGGEGGAEAATLTLPDSDEYLIEVSGYEGSTGQFALSVERFESAGLEIGGPVVVGAVKGESAVFAVRGAEGDGVRVVVAPEPGFDPVLIFRSNDGPVSESDFGGDGISEALTAIIGTEEAHFIEVVGFEGSTGEFSIEVDLVEAIALDLDETVGATIVPSRPFETYSVRLSAGTTIESFEMVRGDGLESSLEISTPRFGSISYDVSDEDFVDELQSLWPEVEIFEDEEWLVTVTALENTSGSYEIRVNTAG